MSRVTFRRHASVTPSRPDVATTWNQGHYLQSNESSRKDPRHGQAHRKQLTEQFALEGRGASNVSLDRSVDKLLADMTRASSSRQADSKPRPPKSPRRRAGRHGSRGRREIESRHYQCSKSYLFWQSNSRETHHWRRLGSAQGLSLQIVVAAFLDTNYIRLCLTSSTSASSQPRSTITSATLIHAVQKWRISSVCNPEHKSPEHAQPTFTLSDFAKMNSNLSVIAAQNGPHFKRLAAVVGTISNNMKRLLVALIRHQKCNIGNDITPK